jgi:hypothetical protein
MFSYYFINWRTYAQRSAAAVRNTMRPRKIGALAETHAVEAATSLL